MQAKVVLIMPYFGILPPYFNFYLRSLEGKNLDVIFFSDLAVEKHPANFKPIKMSLDEFKALTERKLGVPVRIESPRRLCDFKPMYGKIFEDYLKGYDYWAFGDCDLLYGRSFNELLSAVLSSDADVFSLEKLFCCGPLCFIRNTLHNNELFKKERGWVDAVQSSSVKNIGFDEIGSGDLFGDLRKGKITLCECAQRASNFSAAVMLSGDVKFDYREVMEQCDLSRGEVLQCDTTGGLSLNGKPVCVYHYVRPKLRKYFTFVPTSYELAQDFYVDDAGFYVTDFQKRFRRVLNLLRKAGAAIRSLRKNGVRRFFR